VAAVRAFQDRHGLEPDGVLGAGTLAALNVPVESRIRQLEINLERRRWLPAELGPRHLFVNLADFSLRAVEEGATVRRFRLVVGATRTRTPVFAAAMTYLEINPNWDVPHRIASRELLPRIKADPAWLARNHYVLFPNTGPATPIDPAQVAWREVTAARFPYRLRQLPGDDNALGRIKFMFPNPFDVYLHDTPAKALFARPVRAFSHGCMRLENPFALAEWVFQATGTPGWTAERLQGAVADGQRQVVPLAAALPVYVGYATAFVGADGRTQFRPDLYGRDARLDVALHRGGETS
jgi:murein L,D-transpeptidase YcbB/YkuD